MKAQLRFLHAYDLILNYRGCCSENDHFVNAGTERSQWQGLCAVVGQARDVFDGWLKRLESLVQPPETVI
jgi:hypothetical protein